MIKQGYDNNKKTINNNNKGDHLEHPTDQITNFADVVQLGDSERGQY
jgi:hypothetical protein